jgi:hypothetical protein
MKSPLRFLTIASLTTAPARITMTAHRIILILPRLLTRIDPREMIGILSSLPPDINQIGKEQNASDHDPEPPHEHRPLFINLCENSAIDDNLKLYIKRMSPFIQAVLDSLPEIRITYHFQRLIDWEKTDLQAL